MEKTTRNQGIDMQQAFSILPNQILLDNRLDNKSKIIWVYIQGKPKDWDFSADRIGKQLNMSRTSTKQYLKELEQYGYLVRNKLCTGRVEYFLYCPPYNPKVENCTMDENPKVEKATVQKSHGANSDPISNKDIYKERVNSNKETSEPSSQEIPEVIKAFESINPACSRYYGNKTQREAVRKLIEIHTYERVLKIVTTVLPKSNGLAYVPTITTPLQLLEKYTALETALKRAQSNYKKENPQFTVVNGVPIKM